MTLPKNIAYTLAPQATAPDSAMAMDLDPARAALLVHDMQAHFLGAFDQSAEPYRSLTRNIARLLTACRAAGIPVVYSRQPAVQQPSQRLLLSERWGPGITAHPDRQAIDVAVAPAPDDALLSKYQYSAFQQTDLQALLAQRGRDQLIVCGVYAHIGCLLSAAEAFMRGIKPFYVADAMADFDAERHAAAADYVAKVCGVVSATEAIVERLSGAAVASDRGEQRLRTIAEELLEQSLADVTGERRLDDLGLDSLRMMALLEALEDEGFSVTQADLLECVTWADLQRKVEDSARAHAKALPSQPSPAGAPKAAPAPAPLPKPSGPRMLHVRETVRLSARMMRVVLEGEALQGFPTGCPGAHIKLFFPRAGQQRPVLPGRDAQGKVHWPPDDVRPTTRTYSVRDRDALQGTLTVDVVLHTPDGPASAWARAAKPGDAVGVAGPGGSLPQLDVHSRILFVGDLSAMPAIEALLANAPASVTGAVYLVVPEQCEARPLMRPAGVALHFLVESATAAPRTVLQRLSELDDGPPAHTHYFVAGEQALVADVRAHFLRLSADRRAHHYAVPYWKAAQDEETFHEERHRLMDSYEVQA